jgi:hypothetical protein
MGTTAITASPLPAPAPIGPLAGVTWPGSAPVGTLLHDDGERLWAVPLEGRPRLLWAHPPAGVYDIAAAPDGLSIAYSVYLRAESSDDPSAVLYLLQPDGSVRVVDVVDNFALIHSPIFLRPPTEPKGPPRLYWIRWGEGVDPGTARSEGQVMVLERGRAVPVTLPLRYAEAPFALYGYPGGATFSLSLFRNDNVPTRVEILNMQDFYRNAADVSLTHWGYFQPDVNTDVAVGVAWVSPSEYVVPVAKERYPQGYSLRLFRDGCQFLGSHMIYQGTRIDFGASEAPWPILPAGPGRVLVLGAKDVEAVIAGRVDQIPWLAVDVSKGTITKTRAMWYRDGWWTYVQPMSSINPHTHDIDCSDLSWVYP